MHGRAHDREQVPSARPSESFGALAHVRCHLPAVTIEEEGDEYTQTELEKADAEHAPLATATSAAGPISFLSSIMKAGALWANLSQ